MSNIIDESKYEKGLDKRLNINGTTKTYPSYKIPIQLLHYNNLNGRIATYIEEYEAQSTSKSLTSLIEDDVNEYNRLIADYVKKSANDNEVSFSITKADIQQKGQQIPGVILDDGRVIDGNRRFTALRELYAENGDPQFGYFETVVLPTPDADNKEQWRIIKALELNLQFNVDEKRNYNRIDFLVSFYRDVINEDTRVFDEVSYCYASGMKKAEFRNNVRIVTVMLDYLEWIGQPKAFYILKNKKLDGPLEEIAAKTKNMSDEEWDEIKVTIYSHITTQTTGDLTREIRDLLVSAKKGTKLYTEYKKKLESDNILPEILDTLSDDKKKPASPEEAVARNQKKAQVEQKMKRSFADSKIADNIEKIRNSPLDALNSSEKYIKEINLEVVEYLTETERQEISKKCMDLIKILNEIYNKAK